MHLKDSNASDEQLSDFLKKNYHEKQVASIYCTALVVAKIAGVESGRLPAAVLRPVDLSEVGLPAETQEVHDDHSTKDLFGDLDGHSAVGNLSCLPGHICFSLDGHSAVGNHIRLPGHFGSNVNDLGLKGTCTWRSR